MNWYKKATRLTKKASMTLNIESFPYQDDLSQLGSLCYKSQYLMTPYVNEFLEDDNYKEWKNEVTSEWFTPDGEDYFKNTGTINMYLPNVPDESLKLISQMGKQILERLNLTVSNIKKDTSKAYEVPVIRFIISENKNEKPLEPPVVNLSNTNAYHIFRDILNYEKDLWEDGSFDIEELKQRVIYFLGETNYPVKNKEEVEEYNKNIQKGLLGGEPLKGDEWKQPNINELADMLSGRSGVSSYTSDDVIEKLNLILNFCKWALSRGYKKAYLS